MKSLKQFIQASKAATEQRCSQAGVECKTAAQLAAQAEEKYNLLADVSETLFDIAASPVTQPIEGTTYLANQLGQLTVDAANAVTENIYRLVFRAVQWAYTSFLELGFYLTAVGAPIMYAISLMPTKRHFMFDLHLWALFTFSLAEMAYIISLGIVALMLQIPIFSNALGLFFPLAYGLLAPLASGFVLKGGFSAASSFRGGSLSIIGGAGSIVAGVGLSAIYAFRNRGYQRY